jgi:hypothetical protein
MSTTPNCDFGCATVIVASAPPAGARQQRAEVDIEQLVAVQGIDVAAALAQARRELDPAAATEPLGLLGGHDLGPRPESS